MKCHFVLAAVLAVAACPGGLLLGAANDLIPETTANRHGVTRPWFAQVDLDSARSRVRDVVLDRGVLFVQTDRARIHAIDAETGRSIWSKQVGRANHPSTTPGVNDKLLVSLNGSRLYALNRHTGELLYDTEIKGAPGAGAAVSSSRAYVPMVSGMVMAYRLEPMQDARKELGVAVHEEQDEPKPATDVYENLRLRQSYDAPLACQSEGRAMVQPIMLRDTAEEESVCWPTDRGYLNIGYLDKRAAAESLSIRFRKEGVMMESKPACAPGSTSKGTPGTLFFGARDGFVYAISERTGDELWRFSAGDPIVEPVALIDDRVYATTQTGGLICLEAKPSTPAGVQLWFTPKITRFLAASAQRVYALDRLNRFVILNAENGARVDTLPVGDVSFTVTNTETDRVYLITKTGLVQCLHEIELTSPIKHNVAEPEDAADDAEEPAAEGQADQPKTPAAKDPDKAPAEGVDSGDPAAPDPFGAGGADAGGTDAGGADAGGTDAGGTDAGGADAGSDAGADAPADAGDNPFGGQ